LVEVDEIWLNFDSLSEEGSSPWTFAFSEVRDILGLNAVDDPSEFGSGVVGSVVNSVKGPRKNIATATHFLG
jgi:hypothetical protein